jgi:hypothetical protein
MGWWEVDTLLYADLRQHITKQHGGPLALPGVVPSHREPSQQQQQPRHTFQCLLSVANGRTLITDNR